MTDKTFTIAPASPSTYLAISGIFLIMLIPFIALTFSFAYHIKPFNRIVFVELLFMVLIIAIGAIFIYFGFSARNTKFVITDEGLRIKGALYGRSIDKKSLVAPDARIINLLDDTVYRPRIRTNGVGLPGYLEGWFRLKNKEKALLFLTNKAQVIYIPTKDGYSVMLSVTKPKVFLREVSQL